MENQAFDEEVSIQDYRVGAPLRPKTGLYNNFPRVAAEFGESIQPAKDIVLSILEAYKIVVSVDQTRIGPEPAVSVLARGELDHESNWQLNTERPTLRIEAEWTESSEQDWPAAVKDIRTRLSERFDVKFDVEIEATPESITLYKKILRYEASTPQERKYFEVQHGHVSSELDREFGATILPAIKRYFQANGLGNGPTMSRIETLGTNPVKSMNPVNIELYISNKYDHFDFYQTDLLPLINGLKSLDEIPDSFRFTVQFGTFQLF